MGIDVHEVLRLVLQGGLDLQVPLAHHAVSGDVDGQFHRLLLRVRLHDTRAPVLVFPVGGAPVLVQLEALLEVLSWVLVVCRDEAKVCVRT